MLSEVECHQQPQTYCGSHTSQGSIPWSHELGAITKIVNYVYELDEVTNYFSCKMRN